MVKVTAIEPFNMRKIGEEFELPEREAEQAEKKGLVKIMAPLKNKMAAPLENKGNPSQAAGQEQPSSASPAAQASEKTTAKPSEGGESRTFSEEEIARPKRGRPRKTAK